MEHINSRTNCCSNYSSFRKEDKKPTKINAFPSIRKLPAPSELFWPDWKNNNNHAYSRPRDWRQGGHIAGPLIPPSIIQEHNAVEGFKGGRLLGTPDRN